MGRFGLLTILLVIGLAVPAIIAAQDATPEATPGASPQASPDASPQASPVASPGASPVAGLVPDDAPDLAAMMLRSSDFADGYGLSQGALWGVDVEVSNNTEALGRDPDDLRDELVDAGWQLRYLAYFGIPDEADTTFITEGTTSYVTLYADAEGAETGFEILEEETDSETTQDIEDAPELGDQSELTSTTGTDEATGNPFISLDYTFRIENLVAGVSVTDFSGAEPDQARVAELAELVEGRLEAAVDGDAPELFGQILRLEPGATATTQYSTEYYAIIDEEPLRLYNEAEEDTTARAEFLGGNEVEAAYQYEVYILPAGVTDPNLSLAVLSYAYTFADEDAATAFVDAAAENFVDAPGIYTEVTPLDGVPSFTGDDVGATSGVSYELPITDEVVAAGFRYWVQSGTIVVSVQADLVDGLSEDAVVDLTQAQLDCVGQDTLCEPLTPTDDLLQATGSAPATPEPTG